MSRSDNRARHPGNAAGDWYVDERCFDCTAARTVAPGLIVARDGQSVFDRQPTTAEEVAMAWRARLLCPTASIRTEQHHDVPPGLFPEAMTAGVWRLGYNARESFGAHSFLVQRPGGNLMVDAPRWASAVVDAVAAAGGLAHILLTHRDDVADAGRYAEHFGARVWIHEADADAAPYATDRLEGTEPHAIADDVLAVPVPGHTEGSVMFLHDGRHLFTGDSLSWNFRRQDLEAFRTVCWFSWPAQTESLRRLLAHPFEWVFAGHGGSHHLPFADMHQRLGALVERMANA